MGSFTPLSILSAAVPPIGAGLGMSPLFGNILGMAIEGIGSVVAGAQSQRHAKAQASANAAAEANARISEIQQREAIERERRQRALKEALATRRAQMGASGVQSTSGSGQAVLMGLVDKVAEMDEESGKLANLQISEVNRRAEMQRYNLLNGPSQQNKAALGLLKGAAKGLADEIVPIVSKSIGNGLASSLTKLI